MFIIDKFLETLDIAGMDTLFALTPLYPDGFEYFPDFISAEEEARLIEIVEQLQLRVFTFQGYEAKRKVASFGYDWSFETRTLSKGLDIPKEFFPLIGKVAAHLAIDANDIAELLVTEYPEGSVINWHRDAPPFDAIIGISLMADCVFRLRPHDKALQDRKSIISCPVGRRSLYVMRDAARSDWQHSTAPVKEKRYSITLRTMRGDKRQERP